NPAKNVAVPAFESRVKSNTAGSACGCGKTGGIRKTRLCRPGTLTTGLSLFSEDAIDGRPERITNSDSSRKPDQACTICRKVWGRISMVGGGSCGKRHTSRGFHTFRKSA